MTDKEKAQEIDWTSFAGTPLPYKGRLPDSPKYIVVDQIDPELGCSLKWPKEVGGGYKLCTDIHLLKVKKDIWPKELHKEITQLVATCLVEEKTLKETEIQEIIEEHLGREDSPFLGSPTADMCIFA